LTAVFKLMKNLRKLPWFSRRKSTEIGANQKQCNDAG